MERSGSTPRSRYSTTRSIQAGNGKGADLALVHAIVSEWMRKAVHQVRLASHRS
jgi:hypothetical protein